MTPNQFPEFVTKMRRTLANLIVGTYPEPPMCNGQMFNAFMMRFDSAALQTLLEIAERKSDA